MSFVSSKGNILCRLVNIELYKIFAIINRAIKGLHCMYFILGILEKLNYVAVLGLRRLLISYTLIHSNINLYTRPCLDITAIDMYMFWLS